MARLRGHSATKYIVGLTLPVLHKCRRPVPAASDEKELVRPELAGVDVQPVPIAPIGAVPVAVWFEHPSRTLRVGRPAVCHLTHAVVRELDGQATARFTLLTLPGALKQLLTQLVFAQALSHENGPCGLSFLDQCRHGWRRQLWLKLKPGTIQRVELHFPRREFQTGLDERKELHGDLRLHRLDEIPVGKLHHLELKGLAFFQQLVDGPRLLLDHRTHEREARLGQPFEGHNLGRRPNLSGLDRLKKGRGSVANTLSDRLDLILDLERDLRDRRRPCAGTQQHALTQLVLLVLPTCWIGMVQRMLTQVQGAVAIDESLLQKLRRPRQQALGKGSAVDCSTL
mmetsp:Transcript_41473/g.134475  ORF Transcript_41473/g.134475 Transcript_41473/m.134475 type:complete len:341 (-) Transcript_41473:1034-2056(-)